MNSIASRVSFLLLVALCQVACVADMPIAPSLGEPPPGGGGSGSVTAALVPGTSLLRVGETVTFTYTTQPSVAVAEVNWVNENPLIVSVTTPVGTCGTVCATVTALSPGVAQLRPFAIINGGQISAARMVQVVP